MPVKTGDTIAVWFSCGAASAVAAHLTLENWGDRCNVRISFDIPLRLSINHSFISAIAIS